MLQRSGLKDSLFIAMSNYYYDEKQGYLKSLAEVRANNGNLKPFLSFGLKGIAIQTKRLVRLLNDSVAKEIFRSLVHDLYARLGSARKRVFQARQVGLVDYLLTHGKTEFLALLKALDSTYKSVKGPRSALVRDINYLQELGAVRVSMRANTTEKIFDIEVQLDWPQKITETDFFEKTKNMPKSTAFLAAT
jgi:hypothetical protein